MRVRCRTCQGVYLTLLPDGMEYYHACAPETMATVRRGGVTREVKLAEVLAGDVEVSRRNVARANARDENIVVERAANGTVTTRIKSEGQGTEPAP